MRTLSTISSRTSRRASLLPLAALLLAAALPAAAAPPVSALFSQPVTGAPGTAVAGAGYTPFLFSITFANPTASSFTISAAPTFNGGNAATINFLGTGDVFAFYGGTLPFTLVPGGTTQTQVFELDVDGAVPPSTLLTGDLDFEGVNTKTGQQLTVSDPTLRFVTPPAVPEASTTVSLGLLLALGMGGVVVAARRKKAAARS